MEYVQGKCSGYAYLCLQRSPLYEMLSAGDWPPEGDALKIVKQNPKVCSGFLATGGGRFFFKTFPLVGWIGILKRWTGRNRAESNWAVSWRLWHHNINVPQPHALITGNAAAWYVCAAMEGAVSLQEAVQGANMNNETILSFCMRTTEQLARMHKAGIVHGDFKWGNLLVVPDGDVIITDLDSARRYRFVDRSGAVFDLARFLVSGLEIGLDQKWARAVIRSYAAERGLSAADMTVRLCSSIARISRVHQRKYGRKSVCLDSITGT